LTYSWEICSFHYLVTPRRYRGFSDNFSNRLHRVLRLLTLTGTLPSAGNLKPILRACSSLFTHAKSAIRQHEHVFLKTGLKDIGNKKLVL
jgi:hypothetical protein